jgi:hypothetical protein
MSYITQPCLFGSIYLASFYTKDMASTRSVCIESKEINPLVPTWIVTAGFSKKARDHTYATFRPYENTVNIIYIIYDESVSAEQKQLFADNDSKVVIQTKEELLYKKLAGQVVSCLNETDTLDNLDYSNLNLFAKSAGAGVAIFLMKKILFQRVALQAPAEVIVTSRFHAIPPKEMFLGWCLDDDIIPYEENILSRVVHLKKLMGNKQGPIKIAFAKGKHDFNASFVEFIITNEISAIVTDY